MDSNLTAYLMTGFCVIALAALVAAVVVVAKVAKQILNPSRNTDIIVEAFQKMMEEQRKHLDNIVLQQTRMVQAFGAEALRAVERTNTPVPPARVEDVISNYAMPSAPNIAPPTPVPLYDTGHLPSVENLGQHLHARAQAMGRDVTKDV